eukprot:6210983-Pleurochrysis_carterae.AAC.1
MGCRRDAHSCIERSTLKQYMLQQAIDIVVLHNSIGHCSVHQRRVHSTLVAHVTSCQNETSSPHAARKTIESSRHKVPPACKLAPPSKRQARLLRTQTITRLNIDPIASISKAPARCPLMDCNAPMMAIAAPATPLAGRCWPKKNREAATTIDRLKVFATAYVTG